MGGAIGWPQQAVRLRRVTVRLAALWRTISLTVADGGPYSIAGRLRLQAFLLRNDLRFEGKAWSHRHKMWLCNRRFDQPAQQIAFQTYLNAHEHEQNRKALLDAQIKEVLSNSPWGKLAAALQALKGVGPTVAATIIAEVGDFNRFPHPRQLVAYFGLAPGEHSSGGTLRPRGITKAGNATARNVLCEAAWNYRTTPKVGQPTDAPSSWGTQPPNKSLSDRRVHSAP
jgi:transposase